MHDQVYIKPASEHSPKPHWRRLILSRSLLTLAVAAGLFMALPPQTVTRDKAPAATVTSLAPDFISDRDRTLYQSIFALEEKGEHEAADVMLAQLDNTVLAGHVLAQRYLGGYAASKNELVLWLANYRDHHEAARIRQLAARKGAARTELAAYPVDGESLRGDGGIDQVGPRSMPDIWYHGLSQWKEGKYGPASDAFARVGANDGISEWQRAAGHYWAFRSDSRLGRTRDAAHHLKAASEFPTTFYGQLALRQRGQSLTHAASAPRVPMRIYDNAQAVRARALAFIGQYELAEKELRNLYSSLKPADRPAIVALAAQSNLANLQVRLAQMKQLSEGEALYAAYPMPQWLIQAARPVADPTLIMAIARQESVFREDVKSYAGAVGMMQMLPSTAKHVMIRLPDNALASIGHDAAPLAVRLTKPELNIRLGAEYVRQLSGIPAVGDNLIKVLASYNAGPGSVMGWQKTVARKIDDPLLYLESIPYAETRNYVMQVIAHYWVYQSLRGERSDSLSAMARGQWPRLPKTT